MLGFARYSYNALKDTLLMSSVLVGGKLGLRWREALAADLEYCLDRQPHAWGDAIVGRVRALAIWKELLRSRLLISGVIETASPGKGSRILGFGSSVFVTPEFVDLETRTPRQSINSRILASIADGKSVVLGPGAIARANAGSGLDAVFLSVVWWNTSNAIEFSEMMMASAGSCVEAHAGYRIRSVMAELSGEQARSLGAGIAGFDVIEEFRDVDRILARQRKEDAAGVSTNVSNLLFQYREPRLYLPVSSQQILITTLKGGTDEEVAMELRISVPAVKKRWRSIFLSVEDLMPELFGGYAAAADGKRGNQRRHLVLSYVRDHAEELRPFARSRASHFQA